MLIALVFLVFAAAGMARHRSVLERGRRLDTRFATRLLARAQHLAGFLVLLVVAWVLLSYSLRCAAVVAVVAMTSAFPATLSHRLSRPEKRIRFATGACLAVLAVEGAFALLPPTPEFFEWIGFRRAAAVLAGMPVEKAAGYLQGGERGTRRAAAVALGRRGSLEDEEHRRVLFLRQALRDPAPEVRFAAAYGLAEVTETPASVFLTEALQSPDPFVRREMARSLGSYHGFDAVAALGRALHDPDPSVRAAASASLDRISYRIGSGPLSPVLSTGAGTEVRR